MDEVIVMEGDFTPINWWVFLLQGLISIIFGGIALIWAPIVVDVFAYFIGALIILYSISTIVKGIANKDNTKSKILLVILGIAGVLIGILSVMNIGIIWLTFAVLIAMWAFITGFGDLWLGLTAETESGIYRILLVLAGIIAIILGILMVIFPLLGTILIVQVIGAFIIAMGIVSIITGFFVQGKLEA
ncbi:hypothetical protein F1737_03095 [Methanoplanus sp. FWC-SCC4]|uniref:DUF308 domain-containing protein n=1 Tax=Methanochimaera problematica TaxID=2609417 RepID=A0AA97FBB2_9EURY|nr:DUF308 domain-containing protein [Methanoplanus sp. FWC-SCC4]WOF15747.1 hypothetical protein F1737_03095 [Methanoplanus sp. FWC-SCC4]